jgi:hypothetical protein
MLVVEIDNIYLLVAAIIELANNDDDLEDLPQVCTATSINHKVDTCAHTFLALVHRHNGDVLETCFEVTGLWQQ